MTKNIKLNVEFTEAALEKLLGSDLEEFQGLSAMKKARLVSEHIHARLGVDRPRTAAERRAIQNRIQELSDLGIDVTALLAQLDSDGDEDEDDEETEKVETAETETAPAVEGTEVAPTTDADTEATEAEETTQEPAGQVEETEQTEEPAGQVEETEQTEEPVADTPAAKVEAQTQATITEEPTVLPPADLGHGMPLIDEDDDGVTVTFS